MGTKDKQQSKMQDSLISQSLFTSFSSSLGSSFADTSISLSKGGGGGGGCCCCCCCCCCGAGASSQEKVFTK
ncbi:hypothetical protein ABE893_16660 [Enterococcus entomosocium]|uniref:hypothetical protein n=1 Tax=Enterococcus entomosocium TaxID=3034352 RepID=UPI003D6C46D3